MSLVRLLTVSSLAHTFHLFSCKLRRQLLAVLDLLRKNTSPIPMSIPLCGSLFSSSNTFFPPFFDDPSAEPSRCLLKYPPLSLYVSYMALTVPYPPRATPFSLPPLRKFGLTHESAGLIRTACEVFILLGVASPSECQVFEQFYLVRPDLTRVKCALSPPRFSEPLKGFRPMTLSVWGADLALPFFPLLPPRSPIFFDMPGTLFFPQM